MQVKKFEAPTIQDALEVIKRELGPEAIILQTRKMKKGFGLMSQESVEVTAAISERSLQKKSFTESRLRDDDREAVKRLPASRQGDMIDKYVDGQMARNPAVRDRFESGARAAGPAKPVTQKKLTATRYAEIEDAPEQASAAAKRAQGPNPALSAARAAMAAAGLGATGASAARVQNTRPAGPDAAAGAVVAPRGAGSSVEDELRSLKRMIEEMKTTQDAAPTGASAAGAGQALATPALQDAFEQLVLNGMDRKLALSLVKKVAFEMGEHRSRNPEYVLDQLAVEIMQATQVASPLEGIEPGARRAQGPVVIALVGPTGVGKTTTVAKLASEAILRRNLKVGLINLDSYKVAAFDQLGTYAKILNVPFRSIESEEDLKIALRDFASLDVVILDTTGRSQKDPRSLKEMNAMLQSLPEVRTQLVLSVTTRDNELYDQASRFSIFRPQGIIVSKLDEATVFGALLNVSHKAKLPLSCFTTGQRVPEDIEEATRERVAALIMDL